MFSIGEKVVYPLYGAGVVESYEEKEVNGKKELYYVIQLPIGNLTVMLSARKAGELGIRKVNTPEEVNRVIETISHTDIKMSDNWSLRYKENLDKIKTGNLMHVCEVFRNLAKRDHEKGLSNAEKKLLNNAKQILISEVVLSQNMEKSVAEEVVKKALL